MMKQLAQVVLCVLAVHYGTASAPRALAAETQHEILLDGPSGPVTALWSVDDRQQQGQLVLEHAGGTSHRYTFAARPSPVLSAAVEGAIVLTVVKPSASYPLEFRAGATIFTVEELAADPAVHETVDVRALRRALAVDQPVLAALARADDRFAFLHTLLALAIGSAQDSADGGYTARDLPPWDTTPGAPNMGCYWNCVFWTGDHCACWLGCGGGRNSTGSPCPRTQTQE